MAYEHDIAQALPTDLQLGRFHNAIDYYHDAADDFIGNFQSLEYSLDCAEEFPITPKQVELFQASHESFLSATQAGFSAVLRERRPAQEKAAMLATLFQYPLSSYAYTEGMPATGLGCLPPDNRDAESLERHIQNILVHRETTEAIKEILDKRVHTFAGDIPYSTAVLANVLAGVLNRQICTLASSNLDIELSEKVPLPTADYLKAARNVGIVVCAAGIIGLAVGKAAAKHPLKLAGKLLPKSLI